MKTYTLKNNSNKVVNLPPEIWQKANWNLNDKVELTICENYNSQDEKWISISVERIADLEKWSDSFDDSVFSTKKELKKTVRISDVNKEIAEEWRG